MAGFFPQLPLSLRFCRDLTTSWDASIAAEVATVLVEAEGPWVRIDRWIVESSFILEVICVSEDESLDVVNIIAGEVACTAQASFGVIARSVYDQSCPFPIAGRDSRLQVSDDLASASQYRCRACMASRRNQEDWQEDQLMLFLSTESDCATRFRETNRTQRRLFSQVTTSLRRRLGVSLQ